MSLIAINVCLVCNAFETAALPLSSSLCPSCDEKWNASVSYRLVSLAEKKLQRGYGHAHCTVAQLVVRATQLQEIKELVRGIWLRHREAAVANKEVLVLSRVQEGPVFGTLPDNTPVRLPHIVVERTAALMALHSDVVKALRPYSVQIASADVARATFHKNFPVEGDAPVRWALDFFAESAEEKYSPHITLGASPIQAVDKLTFFQTMRVPWRECRLVVSHMGNYCSCFELME